MAKAATLNYRRAGTPAAKPYVPFTHRWYGKLFLLLLSVGLLSLAFAPFKQFYLAWVGLVPWLVVVRNTRSARRAFGWSWVGGVFFFSANMWWLAAVTGPGLIALMLFLGLYWAVAGLVIKGTGLLPPGKWPSGGDFGELSRAVTESRSEKMGKPEKNPKQPPPAATLPLHNSVTPSLFAIPAIAVIWVGLEWFRGSWPFNGLPWLYMGHTQTPVLHLCQIADVTGELGVSFWVVMVNAWVALLLLTGFSLRRVAGAGAVVAAVLVGVAGYGFWRFSQEAAVTEPGPTVMVVQSNIPQSNSGEKGAPIDQIIDFHLNATKKALEARAKESPTHRPGVDLVVWSETMMPPLNREARLNLGRSNGGLLWDTDYLIGKLAGHYGTNLLVGGMYWNAIRDTPEGPRSGDSRNVAYFYERRGDQGVLANEYHKVHLVPFGEYIPFKEALPPLYRMLCSLGPPHMEDYQLHPGDEQNLTVFRLTPGSDSTGGTTGGTGEPPRAYRFVTPICFEDIDGSLVARMFRGPSHAAPTGGPGAQPDARPAGKAADFIVNLTNDGWFKFSEMPQHLQAAQFRSIENRAPTARSVNTGISGFIDSMGRTHDLVPAGTEGTATATLRIDSRVTPFTTWGNVFAQACAATAGLMAVGGLVRWWIRRRRNAK